MKKLLVWVVRIAVLAVLVKVVLWSWDHYQNGGKEVTASEVTDWDKVCRITNPDYGSCVCLHRYTNQRLEVPYEECVQRARTSND